MLNDLLTKQGEIFQENAWDIYPRPQMKRDSFINLNGEWNYAILDQFKKFNGYQGKITVPFSPECILSGVEKNVTPDDTLYYRKKFTFKKTNDRVLLHFGAVDYKCEVSVNGTCFGTHTGGYFPFEIDITRALLDGENEHAGVGGAIGGGWRCPLSAPSTAAPPARSGIPRRQAPPRSRRTSRHPGWTGR